MISIPVAARLLFSNVMSMSCAAAECRGAEQCRTFERVSHTFGHWRADLDAVGASPRHARTADIGVREVRRCWAFCSGAGRKADGVRPRFNIGYEQWMPGCGAAAVDSAFERHDLWAAPVAVRCGVAPALVDECWTRTASAAQVS